ncbi:hypothetical protein BHU61_06580 [Macrococcus epidermidis]|uniref:Phage protein n=1 Tax=Macrococcus epidermidis TaxID=1902580 RepID=A0A327ZTX5_9STAP|nr:hypothetical protein [Macrococcus epidermidis]RAK44974.1 hypothetical protein BHU61_06580 [Macrococcus epidermidis]
MLKEALQWIKEETSDARELMVNGETYSNKQLFKIKQPRRNTIKIATLSGLIDFIQSNFDDKDSNYMIVVKNYNEIELLTKLNVNQEREEVIKVEAELPRITFNEFMSTEDFIIQLQSVYIESETRSNLLKLVGNLKTEAIKTQSDDGVSQLVQVRQGVATVGEEVVPNPVTLKPFRTFTDVIQPESEFVFRLKQDNRGEVVAALFEADGGVWKNIARETIKQYLNDNLANEIESRRVVVIG